MPARVDPNNVGARPANAPEKAQAANRGQQPAAPAGQGNTANQADRVDISAAARAQRAEEMRAAEANAEAEQPEPAAEGGVNRATAEQAAELREDQQQEARRPENAERTPPGTPGEMVDVRG